MTFGAPAQRTNTPGLFFERRYSARTLFNLQASKPVEGPVYQQTPQKQWGQISEALSDCGSLKNLARKVYTELEVAPISTATGSNREIPNSQCSNSPVLKTNESKLPISKAITYQCRCGCGTTVPSPVAAMPADSRTLAVILPSTNPGTPANLQSVQALSTSEKFIAQW